jgi:hypothetical protein
MAFVPTEISFSSRIKRELHSEGLCDLTFFIRYYLSDQAKENEMYEACSMCGRKEKCVQSFGVET